MSVFRMILFWTLLIALLYAVCGGVTYKGVHYQIKCSDQGGLEVLP